MKYSLHLWSIILTASLILAGSAFADERIYFNPPRNGTDDRPPLEWCTHAIGDISMALQNQGMWGDPWANYPSIEWPSGSLNDYLFIGDLWSTCYGDITPHDSIAKWASCSDYGNFQLSPSEGYPLEYHTPGSIAPEQSSYGVDDWNQATNDYPFGLGAWVENYTWDTPGFDGFLASELVITHHSEYGNPGIPLHGLVIAIRGDCDVATADTADCHLDDMVFYDGHAIWCNDPDANFEYVFDGSVNASTQDVYEYRQNPDNPLPPGDPDNIFYHYNYLGADGIPDNDVDENGVSDHFTILARIAGGDTTYTQDPASGVVLFSEGMPYRHWEHTVGDTTYLVVPRNLSYMWDSDSPASGFDDSGEPMLPVYCNGFVGWRLLDCWVVKADRSVERPVDVLGCAIPLSHQWWNWEEDPGSESEMYDFTWGLNPSSSGYYSGPAFMSEWVGDPCTPEAMTPQNPGPFPFVREVPIALGFPVFDYRFLMSIGPISLDDGDSLHIVGGWVAGRGLDGLRMNADLLLDAYHRSSIWGQGTGVEEGVSPVSPGGLTITPNPINSSGTLGFTLTGICHVGITVYDIAGRIVLIPVWDEFGRGEHSISLDVSSLDKGVYFVRMNADEAVMNARFIVL